MPQYNTCLDITGTIRGTSKEKFYQGLVLESLQLRRWFKKLCCFYKIYKNNQPSYLSNIAPKWNSTFNTRNVDKVSLFDPKNDWGWGGREVNLTPPLSPSCGFSKSVSSKDREKPWFFVTFDIILRHIFPENFSEFPQVVQNIWRNSLSILANFHQFSSIF